MVHGWRSVADPTLGTSKIITIGFLVQRTEKMLVVSTSISEGGSAMDPLGIPTAAIYSIKRLPYYIEVV